MSSKLGARSQGSGCSPTVIQCGTASRASVRAAQKRKAKALRACPLNPHHGAACHVSSACNEGSLGITVRPMLERTSSNLGVRPLNMPYEDRGAWTSTENSALRR